MRREMTVYGADDRMGGSLSPQPEPSENPPVDPDSDKEVLRPFNQEVRIELHESEIVYNPVSETLYHLHNPGQMNLSKAAEICEATVALMQDIQRRRQGVKGFIIYMAPGVGVEFDFFKLVNNIRSQKSEGLGMNALWAVAKKIREMGTPLYLVNIPVGSEVAIQAVTKASLGVTPQVVTSVAAAESDIRQKALRS